MTSATSDAEPTATVAVQAFVDDYLDDYEMISEDDEGREGVYQINDQEDLVLRDAINGLIADEDFVTLVGREYIERQKRRQAENCCLGCGARGGEHWGNRPECRDPPREDAEALAAVPQLKDKRALVLYFPTDADRDEFITLIHEAKPGMRTVKL